MKKILFLFLLLYQFSKLNSQITNIIPTSTSIAQTSVADARSWSSFNNPAMLGFVNQAEIGLQYDNRYLLKELSTRSIQFAYPTKLMNVGLSYSYFGYSLYHEMLAGIILSRNFSDKFSMGVQFNYYSAFFVASNSYKGALLPQIGLSVRFSSSFNMGFQTFNPLQTNIQTEYNIKRIPSVFSLGTEYFFAPEFVWRTQIEKEVSSNYRFAMGFDYQMLEQIKIKLGCYGSDFLVPCIGLGFGSGRIIVDLNSEIHPLLGLNTMASLRYKFGK